jgi:hypothetical protein
VAPGVENVGVLMHSPGADQTGSRGSELTKGIKSEIGLSLRVRVNRGKPCIFSLALGYPHLIHIMIQLFPPHFAMQFRAFEKARMPIDI